MSYATAGSFLLAAFARLYTHDDDDDDDQKNAHINRAAPFTRIPPILCAARKRVLLMRTRATSRLSGSARRCPAFPSFPGFHSRHSFARLVLFYFYLFFSLFIYYMFLCVCVCIYHCVCRAGLLLPIRVDSLCEAHIYNIAPIFYIKIDELWITIG